MTLAHVFTPIRLGGVEIPNRIVRTAHATNLGGGTMSEDLIAYHEARARGGVGLTMIEILSVHPSSPFTLNAFAPGVEGGYRKLVDRIRPHGMKLMQQLWHGGHNTMPADRSAPWSASATAGSGIGIRAIPMTKAMIDDLVAAFASAAANVERWGIEGAEIHAAHGYLIAQFLRADTNRREDDYGGSFENRARFLIEVLEAVRASTSRGFALGVRLGADETVGGLDAQDVARLAAMLERRGLVDFLNLSLGNYQNMAAMVGAMDLPAGYMLPAAAPAGADATVPVVVTGRFRTLVEADDVIRSGQAQLVALTRAHIADPDIVRKTRAGHPEQVRPCIACNHGCLGGVAGMNLFDPRPRIGCAVNPGAGRELTIGDDLLTPTATPGHIVVIGGGPAGLEAARVAALRGHRVTLVEARGRLGGALSVAAAAPARGLIGDIVTWLESEVRRLGVEIRLDTRLTSDAIEALRADSIVIATGAAPAMDGIQASNPGEAIAGFDAPHVRSSVDVLSSRDRPAGKTALVIDDIGHYEAIAAAERLAADGMSITYVTRHPSFAPQLARMMTVEPALERLSRGDFRFMPLTRVKEIREREAIVSPLYATNRNELVAADTVVFVAAPVPNRDVIAMLPKGIPHVVVGDANGVRFLNPAISEAHLAAARL